MDYPAIFKQLSNPTIPPVVSWFLNMNIVFVHLSGYQCSPSKCFQTS